jgi:Protein of unknown function (DUF2892)
MTRNVGSLGRIAGLILGIMILGLYGALTPPWRYLTLVGLLPLGAALTGFCPVYSQLPWKRNRTALPQRDI